MEKKMEICSIIKMYYIISSMIPIKKKKSLNATVEEMRNFSFIYIEKYARHFPKMIGVFTVLLHLQAIGDAGAVEVSFLGS